MDSATVSGTLTGPTDGDANVQIKPGTTQITVGAASPPATVPVSSALQLGQRVMFQHHGSSPSTAQFAGSISVDNTNGTTAVRIVKGHGNFSNPLTVLAVVSPGTTGSGGTTINVNDDFIGITT